MPQSLPFEETARIRVLVVEDQRSFRESMEIVIDAEPDMSCVGTAARADEAVSLCARVRPDVVLMDVGLPDVDGIAATERIMQAAPETRVVILTGRPDATVLARAATAGASAFLLKNESIDEILDAIRHESTRRIEIDSAALQEILSTAVRGTNASAPIDIGSFTHRELEVLGQLAEGLQPKQIASSLGITVPTCRGYIKTLLQKLGAHSALEAVVLANRYGLVAIGESADQGG